jgi:hypothetical protein
VRQALLTLPVAALAAIIGAADRAVKAAIVAFFSTLLQRRIVARIDRMSEEFLLRPGPELADICPRLHSAVGEILPYRDSELISRAKLFAARNMSAAPA